MSKDVKVEFSQLSRFVRQFEKVTHSTLPIKKAILECAERYLQDLIRATPKKTGRLKNQWRADNGNLSVRIRETGSGYYLELVNTTEYASWVEKGHRKWLWGYDTGSWVMGRFFVRKTEHIWQSGKLDSQLQKQIDRWLKSALNGGEV